MPSILVLEERNMTEAEIITVMERLDCAAAVEEDKAGKRSFVYVQDIAVFENLLDLFCDCDSVPIPRQDVGGLHIFYAAANLEKFIELTAEDFSFVIDGEEITVVIPGVAIHLGPPPKVRMTEESIEILKAAYEDSRAENNRLEEW